MNQCSPLTGWQRAVAVTVEGFCLLAVLLPRLAEVWLAAHLPEILPLLPRISGFPEIAALVPLLVGALLQWLLISPLRLGRMNFYRALASARTREEIPSLRPLGSGYAWLFAALGWRWQFWWRRRAVDAVACLPAATVWGLGAVVSDGETALLWLGAGAALLILGLGGGALYSCRYAAAPLLLLEGYPAGVALRLSAVVMRHRRAAYLNFFGDRLPSLLSCLAVVPALWAVPRLRTEYAAMLESFLDAAPLPERRSRTATCIFTPERL